jgi:peptidoglycan/LPS O-acetylase OafA/YrhL
MWSRRTATGLLEYLMPTAILVQGRFTVVDALRGIAALGVVLFHLVAEDHHIPQLKALMPGWLSAVLDHGNLGVAIFFVLSGFVISHSLYKERVTLPLAGRFMLRRSIRLDPSYWVAIAFALSFAFLSALVLPDKARPDVSWQQITAHVFYVQEILGYPEINPIFWTLCLEIQFYLIYALLLAATCSNYKATVIVLFTAMAISLLWPIGIIKTGLWLGSFLPLWHGFLLGVGAYWAWRDQRLAPPFLAFAAIVVAFAALRNDAFSVTYAATALLLWSCAMSDQISRGLNWCWLQFLGLISYSLYLIHNPITGASFRVGYMLTGRGIWSEALWFVAVLGACIVAAAIMWWLIERPSMRIARKVRLATSPDLNSRGGALGGASMTLSARVQSRHQDRREATPKPLL